MNRHKSVSDNCTECGLCVTECKFLTRYGNPKKIVDIHDPADKKHQAIPFECSLCGLCAAVCPEDLDPSQMFLAMRREMVKRGCGNYPEHVPALGYEKRGTSRRYTYYAFPEGCDTVFFPGCTLPGTRPHRVAELYEHMRKTAPRLGIVLDCCSKPSHDLGRDHTFQAMFQEMKAYLLDKGIKTVLVACPNCHRIFKEYGGELDVRTVYEVLAETGFPRNGNVSATVTLHDPCAVRSEESVHGAVRELVARSGMTVQEMPHHGVKTLCCGEGGAVGLLTPELAKNWCAKMAAETQNHRVITYCAGCANFLGTVTPTSHLLDLMFEPEVTIAGRERVAKAPFTYWHRLRLKNRFKKTIEAAVTRERTFSPERPAGEGRFLLRSA
jgi:Fe-S oxidoreductase